MHDMFSIFAPHAPARARAAAGRRRSRRRTRARCWTACLRWPRASRTRACRTWPPRCARTPASPGRTRPRARWRSARTPRPVPYMLWLPPCWGWQPRGRACACAAACRGCLGAPGRAWPCVTGLPCMHPGRRSHVRAALCVGSQGRAACRCCSQCMTAMVSAEAHAASGRMHGGRRLIGACTK